VNVQGGPSRPRAAAVRTRSIRIIAALLDLAALKTAARAAIVIPAVFALADKVIDKPQTSILAAFGLFALLVFVEFAGPAQQRLAA
jgi:hypothetical protein